jgi:hypothetical protein
LINICASLGDARLAWPNIARLRAPPFELSVASFRRIVITTSEETQRSLLHSGGREVINRSAGLFGYFF